ncbi:M1 family aminopeptidase [Shewanella khirikhana]|uniref:M1 family aminopeptidase n=1 Tax=Shewanella khirikhana TaxID=1965282 RepID=UPI0030D0F15A
MVAEPQNSLTLHKGMLNEWRFIRCQPLFWISSLGTLGFATVLSQGLYLADAAPVAGLQLQLMALQLLIMPALVAALAPLQLLSGSTYRLNELLAATHTSDKQLRQSQLSLLFLMCFVLMLLAGVPALLSSLSPGLPGSAPGELLLTFIGNTLLYLLPNLLLWLGAALLLCRLGSGVTLYVVLICAMMAYLYLCSLVGSPILAGSHVVSETFYQLMLWLDPMNFTALTHSLALDGNTNTGLTNSSTIFNRVLTLLFAGLMFWLGMRPLPVHTQGKALSVGPDADATSSANATWANLWCRRIRSIAATRFNTGFFGQALGSALADRLNQLLVLVWLLVCANEVASGLDVAEPMARLLEPSSIQALNRIMFDLVPVGGCLLLSLLGWQMVSRGQRLGMAELIAAKSWHNRDLLLAQWLALSTLAALLVGSAMLVTMAVQHLMDSPISAAPYVLTGAVRWLGLALWGGWVLGICHLLRSPLAAAGSLLLLLIVKYSPLMAALGLSHPLWNITNIPLQQGDDFWGYAASSQTIVPYGLLWLMLTLCLLRVAVTVSHRGAGIRPPASRLPIAHAAWLALLCLGSLMLSHSQIVAEKPLINRDQAAAWRADYERQYRFFADEPSLVVTHLDAQVRFSPTEGRADIELVYRLHNPHPHSVATLLVGRDGNFRGETIEVDDADLVYHDTCLGQRLYRWHNAVRPGEERQFRARIQVKQPQWWPLSEHQVVSEGFSYLRSQPLIPVVGYQHQWQLQEMQERREHGLSDTAPQGPDGYDWITVSSTISTPVSHYPLTQGHVTTDSLTDDWRSIGYETQTPIRDLPAWLALSSQRHVKMAGAMTGKVTLQIFAATTDADTLALHFDAMTDTLNWFEANIKPYPHPDLSLVTMPELGGSGYALPQIALLSDKLAFRAIPSADALFDQRYRRAVHETAHQWFGHDLGNGSDEQSIFLVESLTKYLELVLIEQRYGTKAMEALVDYERQRFTDAERSDTGKEPGFIYARSAHQQYSGATLVFATLRATLGDRPIIAALRSLWQQHAYPGTPARAQDFVTALKLQSPEHRALIDELLLTPGALRSFVAKDGSGAELSPNAHRGAFVPR